jgi:hypothetical protein
MYTNSSVTIMTFYQIPSELVARNCEEGTILHQELYNEYINLSEIS